jgi:hypothetical protein
LEGDLTLQLLAAASASGLLRQLDIDPRNRKSLIQLRGVLTYLRDERDKQYERHELLTALTVQICMAIGNRAEYPKVTESTAQILQMLRDLVRPDLKESTAKEKISKDDKLIEMWKRHFGDPEAAERKLRERDEEKLKEKEKQKPAAESPKSKIRNTNEYIRSKLFR